MRTVVGIINSVTYFLRWVISAPCWLVFYPKDDHTYNCEVNQRWRLLVWSNLLWVIWVYTNNSIGILFLLSSGVAWTPTILSATGMNSLKSRIRFCERLISLHALVGFTILSSSNFTAVSGRLLQSLIIKEYKGWHHWCPDTHVTILSVIIITCVVQGVPGFLSRLKISPSTNNSDVQPFVLQPKHDTDLTESQNDQEIATPLTTQSTNLNHKDRAITSEIPCSPHLERKVQHLNTVDQPLLLDEQNHHQTDKNSSQFQQNLICQSNNHTLQDSPANAHRVFYFGQRNSPIKSSGTINHACWKFACSDESNWSRNQN